MRFFSWIYVVTVFFMGIPVVYAEFTSTNYEIESFSIGDAKQTATSTNYGVDANHGLEYIYDAPSSSSGSSGGSGGGGGANPDPEIETLSVTAGTSTALVQWSTDVATRGTFRWGETTTYELGTINQDSFLTNHSVSLTSLTPETTYFFEIYSLSQIDTSLITTSQFSTNAVATTTEPPLTSSTSPQTLDQPTNFFVTSTIDTVLLQWDNPVDSTFSEVILVRSLTGHPQTIGQGLILYTGTNESYFDTQVVQGQTYYYTLFARDSFGWTTQGVLATGILQGGVSSSSGGSTSSSGGGSGGAGGLSTGQSSGGSTTSSGSASSSGGSSSSSTNGSPTNTSTSGSTGSGTSHFDTSSSTVLVTTQSDIVFTQGDTTQAGGTGDVVFEVNKPIRLSFTLPETEQEIGEVWVEVTNSANEEESISVLLRRSLQDNVYTATLDPFATSGSYRYVVSIYDNSFTLVDQIQGSFAVAESSNSTQSTQDTSTFIGSLITFIGNNIWLVLFMVSIPILGGFFFLLFYLRRRDREEDQEFVHVK